ncbi:MAG: D-alanyl-D-alanine carboxypeptidase [Solobacterium sp.]|nr:D-alanyl-D-alanine carboxypeptidase [Solobacterium sp.]
MKVIRQVICAIVMMGLLGGCTAEQPRKPQEDPSTFQAREELSLHCDYVYLIDPDTEQVLMDRGGQERMYPASMTKVMTSILAIEEIPDPETVTIEFTQEMLDGLIAASANRAGFLPGDEPTALDHIYGDLLPSGADCSRALAFYIDGSEEAFVERMNEKAEALGMHDTHFVNTSGLHDDDHYTTCEDMMTLYLYCMENETFMNILKTQVHTSIPVLHFPDGLGMTNFVLMYINQENPAYSQNYMIPGFIAGKSGYTIEGQYTLVSNAEINGMNLVLVNAHGYVEPHYPASIEDASVIYNWYREHYERATPVAEGDMFGAVRVRGYSGMTAEAFAASSITGDLPSDDNLHICYELPEVLEAPLSKGQVIGTVTVYDYDKPAYTADLILQEDCPRTKLGELLTWMYEFSDGRMGLAYILLGLCALIVICLGILIAVSRRMSS